MRSLGRGRALLRSGLVIALVAVACVEAKPEDPLGAAQFVASGALGSTDYVASTPPGGIAAAGAGASPNNSPGVAAVGGSAAQPATPAPPQSTAGSPAATRPGSSAAGSGVAGGSAGMSALSTAGARAPTGGAMAAGAPAPAAAAGTLTIDFKTVNQGGNYAPRNVGAVWIETGAGMFVKTLERWAGIRANHLTRWNAASGGWGSIFGGGNSADMMDAVSRATLRSHEMHHVTWNMKDATGKVIADGMYNVVLECTESNRGSGANASIPFMKGAAPVMATAPDKSPYSGFSLNYQP